MFILLEPIHDHLAAAADENLAAGDSGRRKLDPVLAVGLVSRIAGAVPESRQCPGIPRIQHITVVHL